jgi:hypothetical protein
MGEAMELAKMMAATKSVPPHLRGNAGDCLAVVMFASRVEADPFAVASKSYFVNDRMAYEAQLVMALINTRAPLVGRLNFLWSGEGNGLVCTVSGKLRGDPDPKVIVQEIATITTKNSPLWKSSPKQQLGYYTARMWGRLHCPEVLLGIYTPDEIQDMGALERGSDGSYSAAPASPRPTRASVAAAVEAEPVGRTLIDGVGEVVEEGMGDAAFAIEVVKLFKAAGNARALEQVYENNQETIETLPAEIRDSVHAEYEALQP